ncbi:DUF6492 family protein [Aphanothece sacrum]|uniref:Glycosyl transferase n=1 Tax=Aphanothece sacrum FPU1 TaxID=1920663 RepID=A0A401IK29_APHSA|nr:DUF6492 family protein [Aphanothece sacrum]GBF81471.1 hypothetical protein AsFPU1_2885 [Aphanothece sacrum FPU1]GBF85602.1 hypothetical protein AsFPU3_2665 [Aphanothece sacrum FPU3]
MKQQKFGVITLSYSPDFERCELLSWSIEKSVNSDYTHYIIVDKKDLTLFNKLKKRNTEIIAVESILPWWIKKIPGLKNGWISFKSLPVRNWIIQQITKIAVSEYLEQDVLVFIDSDVAFVRKFDLNTFIRGDKVRLFKPVNQRKTTDSFTSWYETASNILGLTPQNYPDGYIGNLITWKRENVLKMHQRIEQITRRSYIEVLCNQSKLSEYVLYGVFVDYILKEKAEHFYDQTSICQEYWKTDNLEDEELGKFFTGLLPSQVSVMISAKAKISVKRYEKLLKSVDKNQ